MQIRRMPTRTWKTSMIISRIWSQTLNVYIMVLIQGKINVIFQKFSLLRPFYIIGLNITFLELFYIESLETHICRWDYKDTIFWKFENNSYSSMATIENDSTP